MSENQIKVAVVNYPDRRYLTMRYIDPVTGKQVARSTGTTIRREAERVAAKWEAELHENRYSKPSNISWEDFRDRYETEKLASLSSKTLETALSALNHLEEIIQPQKLAVLTSEVISKFQAKLRATGIKETSIATHLRHLRAALSWAVSMGMLVKMPDFHMPKRARGRILMRGRPITSEEFERMLSATSKVRPKDTDIWTLYLQGLWLSGLRLEESLIFSWEDDAPLAVDLSGRHPRFRIYAEAEKGHQDRFLPMTPDFAEFLMRIPQDQRFGAVFKLDGLQTSQPITPKRVGRIVSTIGRRAGVVVNKAEKKFASAHDLRRSFGTRWAGQIKPATLQLLMRHKSIETTLKYYVAQDADDIADELWKSYRVKSNPLPDKSLKRL